MSDKVFVLDSILDKISQISAKTWEKRAAWYDKYDYAPKRRDIAFDSAVEAHAELIHRAQRALVCAEDSVNAARRRVAKCHKYQVKTTGALMRVTRGENQRMEITMSETATARVYSQTPVARLLRTRKTTLKANGLCQDCGACPPERGKTLCYYCLGNRRDNARIQYAKRKG